MLSWLKSKFRKAGADAATRCVVTFTDERVTCTRPNGLIESVAWDDLQAVIIETTDEGPFATDVFWLLLGEGSGCVVPQDAVGNEELLRRLQTLPNFDNEAVITAMGSTENRRFLCWRKETTAG